MAKVLVYYPFKMNAWFGKAVTFTLNSQKYEIQYCTENRSEAEKILAFQSVILDPHNKLYIVGHCAAGEDEMASEPEASGTEESKTYTELARKITTYAVGAGDAVLATIKVLACESGAALFGAAPVKAVYEFFGEPVPKRFLSFAQKLWDELYYQYGFRCPCHAYTRSVFWEINKQTVGETVVGVKQPTRGHRYFIDDDDVEQRAKACRIVVVATPRG